MLYNVNGSISSSVFMAIMGGTADKSTLLNALSGRTNLNQYNVTGNLSIHNLNAPINPLSNHYVHLYLNQIYYVQHKLLKNTLSIQLCSVECINMFFTFALCFFIYV